MPLMDLTTPVELYAVEVLRDSTGRAQAYFTFMNCAAEPLRTLYATLTLLDDGGKSIGQLFRCAAKAWMPQATAASPSAAR